MSEPAHTVTAEGPSLAEALQQAAVQLGVPASFLDYKFDLEHFRSKSGRPVGVDTVRVIAWSKDPETMAVAASGKGWLEKLLELMGMRGAIEAVVKDKTCELRVSSEDARFLVGRQGTTLRAIQELLDAAMANAQPGWAWRVDVEGGRREGEGERRDRDDRGERRDREDRRGDRGDRGDRGERRDRGDRGDRGERRGDRGDRGERRGDRGDRGENRRTEQDLEKLRRLALRLAEEVARTGEPTELRRELNSFERRVVHMAVSEVEGVYTESVGDGPMKQVRILPTAEGTTRQSSEDDSDER